MTETKPSLRYWVVNCLGCKNPIPLFAARALIGKVVRCFSPGRLQEGAGLEAGEGVSWGPEHTTN
jgi:hypothetical protein